ncbi:hypothetical protein JHD50_09945 [Sulfurimonas sp. MAG313]|nr:hypothetical protein [Sulfurimonas sp. MAG313]MDF1881620.1 hypothetical protein [Sulfurimonas sp. MAG313]
MKYLHLFLFCSVLFFEGCIVHNDTKSEIYKVLSMKSSWRQKMETLEKEFIIEEVANKEELEVLFTQKNFSKLKIKVTFSKDDESFYIGEFIPPDFDSLTKDELIQVDTILAQKKALWMFASTNQRVLYFDLSKGYLGLAEQAIFPDAREIVEPEISSRLDGDFALIYYKNDTFSLRDNVFTLQINLKEQRIENALWTSFIGLKSSFSGMPACMITDAELTFFNESLGLGLDYLIQNNNISIYLDKKEKLWHFSVNTKSSQRSFTIDAESKQRQDGPDITYASPSPRSTLPKDFDGFEINDEIDLVSKPSLESYKDYIGPMRYTKAFDMPSLDKNLKTLSSQDKDFIDKSLKLNCPVSPRYTISKAIPLKSSGEILNISGFI